MEDILSFNVLPFTGISDHCCVSLNIKSNIETSNNKPLNDNVENININNVREIFTFDPTNEKAFLENIKTSGKTEKLSDYLNHVDINREQIDNSIGMLNDILLSAAKKSLMFKKASKKGGKNTSPKTGNKSDWYTKECKARRDILRKHSRNLCRTPFSRKNHDSLLKARSIYKKTCRNAEK